MKQIERIGIIAAFIFLLIPINSFAQEGGYFHNKAVIYTNGSTSNATTDGDPSTGDNLRYNPQPIYQFPEPANVRKVYLDMSAQINETGIAFEMILEDGTTQKITHGMKEFTNGGWSDLSIDNVIEIRPVPTSTYRNDAILSELDFITEDMIGYSEPVSGLSVKSKTYNSITLKWINPAGTNGTKIFQNGQHLIDIGPTETEYTVTGLSPETEYEFKIIALYDYKDDSEEVTISAKTDLAKDSDGDGIPDSEDEYPDDPTNTPEPETPEDVPEIKNLQIETDGERADLSWTNPPKYFEKAKIYRKDLGTVTAFNLNPFSPMTVSASEGFKPLFETNGTEFSDLTIEPENEYEYKVTSNYNGMESKGAIVSLTIPKPPLVDTSGMEMPFGVGELIKSGNGLLALIGGFVLIALAFILVPKVIGLIRNANAGGNGSSAPGRIDREGKQPRITDRQLSVAVGSGRAERQPRLTKRQAKGG